MSSSMRDRRKESWFGSPFFSPEDDVPVTSASQVDGDQTNALARAPLDWRHTHNAHVLRAHIPGLKREEVKVHVEDGNVLQISGERRTEQEDGNDTWRHVERQRGSFVRRFRLPENAEVEGFECGVDDGVLTVTVPKRDA